MQKVEGGGGEGSTHTPPPVAEAWMQWIAAAPALVIATDRWYVRHESVLPGDVEPAVPGAIKAVALAQSLYAGLMAAHVA